MAHSSSFSAFIFSKSDDAIWRSLGNFSMFQYVSTSGVEAVRVTSQTPVAVRTVLVGGC